MKKLKAYFRLLAILAFILPCSSFAQERELGELKEMRDDIQIINLLNGLNLRKEQMEFIIGKASQVQQIRSATLNEIASYETDALKAYGAIKQDVQSGRVTVEQEDAIKFNEIKHRMEDITKDTQQQVDKIADEVEVKLEEFQLIALDGYKPCIIPIMNKGRIGQSDADTGITKVLERVKASPGQIYSQRKDEFVSRILDRIKSKIPPQVTIDEANVSSEIMKTFEEVRNMDDVDFQVKKTAIAEELHNKILPEKFSLSRKDKIKKFLLTKNIIPILEERLDKLQ